MAKKRYRSDVLASVHEAAADLAKVGVIDKATMRAFDAGCLTRVEPLTPSQIKTIREREHVSQAVFAAYLHVTTSLVSKWERGEKKPQGASLKLLNLVRSKGLDAVA
ncbi:MAG: DNA-binding transcriptional regulator [Hyphomonadaceae bacterium]|nr:DNA-binding transcriptional regulator [Hyphomonadaceae bacterium]